MAVLDGQQRLTSIYIGLTGSYAYRNPRKQWKNDAAFLERRLYLNIVGPAKNDTDKYEFSFLTEGEAENDNEHYWFAVGNILNMPELGDVIIEASNPVPTPLLGHRCRSSQEITGSPTPFSTSNHYLWICPRASFSLSNPNIAA